MATHSRRWRLLVVWAWGGLAALGLAVRAGAEDEIDMLLKEVKLPACFKDYQPNFSLEDHVFKTWIIHDKQNPKYAHNKADVKIVTDHGRFVAQYEGSCRLHFFYHAHPGFDVRPLMDCENLHFLRHLGSHVGLGPPIASYKPLGYGADEEETAFLGGGETIGWQTTWRWRPDGSVPGRAGTATAKTVLRVDPVLGYVVDLAFDWKVKPVPMTKPRDKKAAGEVPLDSVYNCLFSDGIANPWPDQFTYAHFVYTPSSDHAALGGAKYAVFANNGAMVRTVRGGGAGWPRHCPSRGGGFVGYLRNRHGWGLAETLTPVKDVPVAMCPDCTA